MSKLNIHTLHPTGVTIIPNSFLDKHMPQANGEFVKIYLYLLRAADSVTDFSLSTIADCLNCTERDVLRALKYWAKEGLLAVSYDSNKKPTDISFLDSVSQAAPVMEVPKAQKASVTTEVPSLEPAIPARSTLTADKVKQLKENEQVKEMLFVAQQYLGKTLTSTETNRILYFYEELGLSSDLIVYLIEYCVCHDHKSINYIEKVAFAWKEQGIETVEEAKKNSNTYHKDYYAILKALGISNRNPIEAEIKIMDVWIKDYGFSIELITEACTRTIMATKNPSLQYADRILQSWREADVKHIQDVKELDKEREKSKAEKAGTSRSKTSKPKNSNFTSFDQRSYDFDSLESQLLKQ